jgi:AraC-like DNA-binding protein
MQPLRAGQIAMSNVRPAVDASLAMGLPAEGLTALGLDGEGPVSPPGQREVLEGFLGAPLDVGACSARLTLDAEVLARPLPSADQELATFFLTQLRTAAPADEGLLGRVQEALQAAWLRGEPATSRAIGRQLAMSTRTLQRRLEAEGTSFADVRERTRSALADRYLARDDLTLVEVAYLLGYRDETSFWRAYRRWRGCTPADARAGAC